MADLVTECMKRTKTIILSGDFHFRFSTENECPLPVDPGARAMGGAAGTAGTAAAVPLLREVLTARQGFAVPYFSKKIHKHIGDLVLLI